MEEKKITLLSIDCGTQSIRALLWDLNGQLLAKSQVPLDDYFSVEEGASEHHANAFWDALCHACRLLWQKPDIDKNAIAAVSLTTQRATVVNLDKNGEPLRPAITWLDERRATQLPRLSPHWRAAFHAVGVASTVKHFMAEAEVNWLKQHQPQIWQQTDKFLLLSGFLTYRLTGEAVDSVACQVGYLPFDYKRQQWARKGDWKWQACPIEPDKLPELLPVGSELGKISEPAAQATGIPAGLPLIAAAADKACEVLGAGCITPQDACISYGTTATINTTNPNYIEPIRYLPAYPAAIPQRFNTEFQISRGYWMVSWFKQEFGHPELRAAEQSGARAEQLLDELLDSVPAGCEGLVLQPYWSPSVRHPGPEARGAIVGFSDRHTRAHLYRAILEGIAFSLREGKERIERRAKTPIKRLVIAGGGAQSDAVMQLTADIFNLPAKRPHTTETSGLGAAINAAVGIGCFKDYASAAEAMCHSQRTFAVNPAAQQRYQQLYDTIYRPLYARLRPIYKKLKRIQ